MPRRLVPALLAFSLLLPSAGLIACGDDDNSDRSASELLSETFGGRKSLKSGKLDLNLRLDLRGLRSLEGPVAVRIRGPFETEDVKKLPHFDFTLNLDAGGEGFSAGAVSTGENGFVKLQGRTYELGKAIYEQFRSSYEQAQKESEKQDKDDDTLSTLGIKPVGWLKGARRSGEEQVGGADTVHLTAGVDVPRFLTDVSRLLDRARRLNLPGRAEVAQLTAKQRGQIERSVRTAKIDVWTGKSDTTMRRLALDIVLDVPQDARRDVGGLQGGRIRFDMTFADLNKGQGIAAPKGARPFTELAQALQALGFGDITGAAGGGSQSGGGTQTTPQQPVAPNAPREYLDCLERAGAEIAEIQKCAALLS